MAHSALAVDAQAATTSEAAPAHPFYKAHLDYKFMKDNVELLIKNVAERKSIADPAAVVALYDEFVLLKIDADAMRAERNENSSLMKVLARIHACGCCMPMRMAGQSCTAAHANKTPGLACTKLSIPMQSKMEAEKRQGLVARGQELKEQLSVVEAKLTAVSHT